MNSLLQMMGLFVFSVLHIFPQTFLGDLFALVCRQELRAYICGQKICIGQGIDLDNL